MMPYYDIQIIGKTNENELTRDVETLQFDRVTVEHITDIIEQLEVEGFINYNMVVNRIE